MLWRPEQKTWIWPYRVITIRIPRKPIQIEQFLFFRPDLCIFRTALMKRSFWLSGNLSTGASCEINVDFLPRDGLKSPFSAFFEKCTPKNHIFSQIEG
jgi:hypothetical protein